MITFYYLCYYHILLLSQHLIISFRLEDENRKNVQKHYKLC